MLSRSITDVRGLGAAIREARADRGWTQADLAERAGVSRAFVLDIERGARPRAELARTLRVLRALDKSIRLDDDSPESFDEILDAVLG